ncbi:MAG: type II toxin-antitoxin system PemK/MazF family toxin, partial [Mycobacteriaceae bacterium]|nr:type II toxin-antitoxin system PemK/MazF family toxin [Mycobacteriaceae bacterium]
MTSAPQSVQSVISLVWRRRASGASGTTMTMPPTTRYSFGDVVLVPFPFTDQSTSKKRPAVVVSSDAYHQARPDLVI